MYHSLATITNNLPPIVPGIGGYGITALQILTAAGSFSNEANPETRAKYSKFAKFDDTSDTMISSRHGMIIIYVPAFLVASALYILPFVTNMAYLPEQSLAEIFLIIHFGKRLLEVLFLHQYSGRVGRGISSTIAFYYTLVTLLISYVSFPGFNNVDNRIKIGTSLFAIGIAGNFYHHYILARLRSKSKTEPKYFPPKGGLFEYVAAPHYLFELIGWLGIAVVSQHMNSYLNFVCMTSYLSGRAYAHNSWNRSKFCDEWDENRKNIIPFIF